MNNPEGIWRGIFGSFHEVPTQGSGFASQEWIEKSLRKARALRELAKENATVPRVAKFRESVLPIVSGIVYNEKGRLRILDFGGGIGFNFYQVLKSLPNNDDFKYHIVELEAVCDAGREFFKAETNIFFHDNLDMVREKVDIIHMGSSLHYIEKWRETLGQLCARCPTYLTFTDLTAGDIPTYASSQKYYDSRIPVWFFNVGEVIEVVSEQGFRLIFKSSYVPRIKGIEDEFPQDNFEKEYQLGYSCNLLFAKDRKT